jgi:hypothetical protein
LFNEILTFLYDYAIPSLVSSGIALLALKYLGDKLIGQILKKESQKYEALLQEKATFLKTSLSIYAKEQNISNRRIDQQKANAIHQVYSGIVKVARPISRIIAGSPYVTDNQKQHIIYYHELAEEAHTASSELSELLVNHAIYFEESVYKQIADFSNISSHAIANFLRITRENFANCTPPDEIIEKIENHRPIIEKMHREELHHLHYKLIKKFRVLLGIEKE